MTAAASITPKRICLADFIGINLICCCSSHSFENCNCMVPAGTRIWDFRAIAFQGDALQGKALHRYDDWTQRIAAPSSFSSAWLRVGGCLACRKECKPLKRLPSVLR